MIAYAFGFVAVLAAGAAAFLGDLRRATLALWVAGLAVGGIYLTVGAETLAVVQWIVSTLIAISLIFFAVMFGEYGAAGTGGEGGPLRSDRRRLLLTGFGAAIGIAFAAIIGFGAGPLPESLLTVPGDGNDLLALGRVLTEQHLVSLEILALTLLLTMIGGGVVARPEGGGA